jgi:hypothetical protein
MFDYFTYESMTGEHYNQRLQKAEETRWFLRWKAAHPAKPKRTGESTRLLQLIYLALELGGLRLY